MGLNSDFLLDTNVGYGGIVGRVLGKRFVLDKVECLGIIGVRFIK